MKMQPKVSVIISNRNNGDLVKRGIANLEEIKTRYYQNLEVIVIDRKSTDNSVKIISEKFPWVQLINSENKGLAFANNLGAKHATGDYLLFLGADGYPRIDTITKLVEYMEENKKVGITSPRISLEGGEPDRDASRSFPEPWNAFTRLTGLYKLFPTSKLFSSYFKKFDDLHVPYETDSVVAGFMLISKEAFEKVKGFDADYFAFGEDLDICYRMKKAGYKIVFLPQWESGHIKVKFSDKNAPLADKIKMTRSSTNAMRLFMSKNYKNKYSSALLGLMAVGTYVLEAQRVTTVYLKHLFSGK